MLRLGANAANRRIPLLLLLQGLFLCLKFALLLLPKLPEPFGAAGGEGCCGVTRPPRIRRRGRSRSGPQERLHGEGAAGGGGRGAEAADVRVAAEQRFPPHDSRRGVLHRSPPLRSFFALHAIIISIPLVAVIIVIVDVLEVSGRADSWGRRAAAAGTPSAPSNVEKGPLEEAQRWAYFRNKGFRVGRFVNRQIDKRRLKPDERGGAAEAAVAALRGRGDAILVGLAALVAAVSEAAVDAVLSFRPRHKKDLFIIVAAIVVRLLRNLRDATVIGGAAAVSNDNRRGRGGRRGRREVRHRRHRRVVGVTIAVVAIVAIRPISS